VILSTTWRTFRNGSRFTEKRDRFIFPASTMALSRCQRRLGDDARFSSVHTRSGETGTDLFFETGGRLHTAIREDASMNLAAIDSFSPPGPSPVYRDRFQPR
jgi:hypothetical protein